MRAALIAATAMVIGGFSVQTTALAESAVERLLGVDNRGDDRGRDREYTGSSSERPASLREEQREETADDCARLRRQDRRLEEDRDDARSRSEREQLDRQIGNIRAQLEQSCRR
jgi:hypothetical protein